MTHDFTLSGLKQYRILCYNTKKYVCKTTSQRTHQVIVVLSVRNWIFSKTKTSATGTRTGNFLFREVSSLTTHILATDTDIIIQIPAVFVKVTKAKSREKRENLYQSSTQILFCAWKKYAPHRLAPSFSPSTIGMKGAVENVKKRREHLQAERRTLGRSIH